LGKVFQTLICLIFLIGLALAASTYQQSTDIDIKHPVRIDGAIPTNTVCNITIYYPNNTLMVDFQPMTNNGSFYNYTIDSTFTGTKGIYNYDILCSNGELNSTQSYDFLINLGGVEPSTSRTDTTTRNIIIFFGLAIFCFIGFIFTKKFPVKASLFLIMIWFILMGLSISFISLQDEVVNPTIESFFSSFLAISFIANWFIFSFIMIIWTITFFVSIFDFNKQKKREKYGEE